MAVYFFQVGEDGPIKIGFTGNSVRHRLSVVQMATPYRLRVRAVIPEGDRSLEFVLHRTFRKHWIRGEWYLPHVEILKYIAKYGKPLRGKEPSSRRANLNCPPIVPPSASSFIDS